MKSKRNKEDVLNGLKEAVKEVNLVKEGRIKLQSGYQLLRDLEEDSK